MIVDGQGGHAQEINPQVEDGPVDQVGLGAQQPQQRRGKQNADQQHQHPRRQADHQGRVDRLFHLFGLARAVKPGHQDIDAAPQTDQKTGDEGDKNSGGTHRAQGLGAGEPAHHRNVRHIEEGLQQIGEDQRHAEDEDLPRQRPFRQILCLGRHSTRFSFFRFFLVSLGRGAAPLRPPSEPV